MADSVALAAVVLIIVFLMALHGGALLAACAAGHCAVAVRRGRLLLPAVPLGAPA